MKTATRSSAAISYTRSASVAPASFDATARTVDVTWTTGAPVERFDIWEGAMFIETLEVTPQAIRLGRLDGGAAVLDSHDMYELGAVLGSVVPGSVRIANGEGTATVRLSDAPDAASTVDKIVAGHVRSVSVGYQVHTFTRFTGEDGQLDEFRATDWEPLEISFVTVPADPGCTVRSRSDDMTRIIEGGRRSAAPALHNRAGLAGQPDDRGEPARRSDDDTRIRRDDPAPQDDPTPRIRRSAAVTTARIRDLCARANFPRDFEADLLTEHGERAFSETELLRIVNDELMGRGGDRPTIDARVGDVPNPAGRQLGAVRNGGDAMAAAMEDALYARMSGATPTESAREFMGASMADMARGLMERRGERVRWTSASGIMQRFGGHTTSDFPNLLQAATGRYLIDLYNGSPSPLKVLAGAPRLVPDFRQINALAILPIGVLRPVPENAEFKRVTIQEGLNGYKLATYGEIFTLTRQAFVNDDLGYFASLTRMWANAANETEATQLAGLITANGPVMGDGQNLYSTAHGNLSASGDLITPTTLATGRLAMRSQRNPDGVSPANVTPKYLVVGPAKETEAEIALASLAPTNTGEVNPFSGKLTLIVEPRIVGNSWRLFADPNTWPVLEYAQLAGQQGLFTDTRVGFDVDGFDFKSRLDFGCGPVDWRGTYKNSGN